jgi:hypothetical protein
MGPMRRPWWIAAVLAWVGVVAVVALVAWLVIDSAGEEILGEPSRDAVTPTVLPSDRTSDQPSEPTRSTKPSPRASNATEHHEGTDPTVAPTSDPTTVVPPTSVAPPPRSSDPEPVTRTMSWQGDAGMVRVSCTGPQLRLEGASPADGYEVDTNEHNGGSELEVRFRSRDGDREVRILATCVGGTPRFRVESD